MASCFYQVVWKGQDGVLAVPFNVSGYSDLSVAITTTGLGRVNFSGDSLSIEDGYIMVDYDNTDLDVLPDGVIRYIVDYDLEGVDCVDSGNLNAVLKTPEGYSAETGEQIYINGYESGYTAGYESGMTEGFEEGYSSGKTDGFPIGYQSGYTDGDGDGYDRGFGEGYNTGYTAGSEDGFNNGYNSGYTDGTADGYRDGYTDGNTEGFNSGYTNGRQEGYEAGESDGYGSGYTSGFTDGRQEGVTAGFAQGYNSGYTDGNEAGFNSGYTNGKQEGYESGYTDGFSSGHTNGYNQGVSDGFEDGHTSGYTEGVSYQKSLISSTAITINGDYTNANGWSAVTVNVPQTGATPEQVQAAYNSGYTEGHSVGENEGWIAGLESGYTNGENYQKSLLVSTAVTENGTYERENGYNRVVVNIAQTGATPQQVQAAYNSGLTGGYSSGITYQKSLLTDITITGNGEYTRTDGYNSVNVSVPQTGATPEQMQIVYESGITEGTKQQRALLSATTLQANGTYTSYNGWSAVTVQVATTGYTEQDLINAFNSGFTSGYISGYTDATSGVDDYLGFEVITAGFMDWNSTNQDFVRTIEYSKDNGSTWSAITSTTGSGNYRIWLDDNSKILFRGNNASYGLNNNTYTYFNFGPTLTLNIVGNIMSLIDSNGFRTANTLTENYAFYCLFEGAAATAVLSVNRLKLPATTLSKYCYTGMFMFCRQIRTAPELPAPVLMEGSYYQMFSDCENLQYIKCLATDISATNCTKEWTIGITETDGTFVKNPNMSGWTTGYNGIPNGWTIVDAS